MKPANMKSQYNAPWIGKLFEEYKTGWNSFQSTDLIGRNGSVLIKVDSAFLK